MANTYVNIASQTLGSSAASVTFSSIPGTYTDLLLKCSVRTDASGFTYDNINFRFNSSSVGNYSRTNIQGDGANASSQRTSATNEIVMRYSANGASATANTFGSLDFYIPNYLVSQNKSGGGFGVSETNSATSYMATTATLWSNTAAISSIYMYANLGGNFVAGSTFYLYGIKNS